MQQPDQLICTVACTISSEYVRLPGNSSNGSVQFEFNELAAVAEEGELTVVAVKISST
jgi:hypothetical protein